MTALNRAATLLRDQARNRNQRLSDLARAFVEGAQAITAPGGSPRGSRPVTRQPPPGTPARAVRRTTAVERRRPGHDGGCGRETAGKRRQRDMANPVNGTVKPRPVLEKGLLNPSSEWAVATVRAAH
jgi:hypothetical protein